MIKVYKISEEQANELRGKESQKGVFFDPPQDADGNWYISKEEKPFCGLEGLVLITYKPTKRKI